jgi:hypothetical protein
MIQRARGSTIEDLNLRREGGKGKRPEYILTDVLQVWFQPIPLTDVRKSPDLTGLPVTITIINICIATRLPIKGLYQGLVEGSYMAYKGQSY